MSYQCMKPQCGREVHRSQFKPNMRCYCGALIKFDASVQVRVLLGDRLMHTARFELPSLIKVGRKSRLLFGAPDLDLSPYLERGEGISREHLSLLLQEDLSARVNLESKKSPMVVNHVTMRPGDPPEVLSLPLNVKLTRELSLHVEVD